MTFETIKEDNKILAIVVTKGSVNEALNFITPDDFGLQVGIHNRPKNTVVAAHEHMDFEKVEKLPSQEIFYIESGKVKVGIFQDKKRIRNIILSSGDMIILNAGHDVEFLEDSKMIEIKQGPYRGNEKEKKYL